jgi:hypothetical protein
VHNGLSTEANGLLTKVQAMTHQTAIDSITDLATPALANIETLQELPNFVSEDQAGVNVGIIDFLSLGGTNDTTITDPMT